MDKTLNKNRSGGGVNRRRGIVLIVFCFVFFPLFARAELRSMSEDQLKSATAQAGIAEFTLNNNTARIFLDIHMETLATIDTFSAGYYNVGWDQSWTSVSLGTDESDLLTVDGLVFIADFDDLSLSDPSLERVIVGSNRLQGSLSAMISSYSGIYSNAVYGGGSPNTALSRYDLSSGGTAQTTFEFNSDTSTTGDQGLFMVLNLNSSNVGIQVVAGYNENTIPDTSTGTPWWDSP